MNNECEVILECRVCRNLFRSLANFITHKKHYCYSKYEDVRLVSTEYPNRVQDMTDIYPLHKPQAPSVENRKRTLDAIIHNLNEKKEREKPLDEESLQNLYDSMQESLNARTNYRQDSSIVLEKVPNNPNAVFQASSLSVIKNPLKVNFSKENIEVRRENPPGISSGSLLRCDICK